MKWRLGKKVLLSGKDKILRQQLKAGVLPFVLSICLIVAVFCSAAILLVYFHKINILQAKIGMKLQENTLSAIELGLASLDELPEQEWYTADLFGQGNDSVRLRKEAWGAFHILKAEAYSGRHVAGKLALLGAGLGKNKPALYLADQRRPLSIAGEARIAGDAYLPKAGIRADYVNRRGYSRNRLVFGQIFDSELNIPAPEAAMLEQIKKLLQQKGGGGPEKQLSAAARNSFGNELAETYYAEGALQWKDSLEGKILLISATEIEVQKGAYLRDVILIAPKITFKSGFKGRLQAFAGDTLVLEEGVELQYPSVAGIISAGNSALLRCMPGSDVKGILFLFSNTQEGRSLLKIEEKAVIVGEVWSNAYVQHQGEIKGTLSCRKFYLRTPATIYENYLFNGQIDRPGLPEYFVSSALLNEKEEKSIVKWLY